MVAQSTLRLREPTLGGHCLMLSFHCEIYKYAYCGHKAVLLKVKSHKSYNAHLPWYSYRRSYRISCKNLSESL